MLCGAHVLNALQLLRLWQGQFARPACTEPCARAKRCYQRAGACNEFVPFLLLLPPLRSSHAYSVYAPTKHTPHLQTNLGVTRPPCKCQAVPSATHSTPSFKSPSLPPLSPPPAHSSPVFLMATSFLTTAVSLLLAAARLPALYPLSLAAGFGFGAHWSLMPSLASELFGLHHFATNYTMLQLAPAVGSLALASRLAGWVYQMALERQGHTGNTCRGQQCFQLTFLVVAGLGLVATCCSTWLYFRTREMYYCITFVAVHQHDHDVERHPFSLPEPQPNERQKQVKAQ